MSKLQEGAKLHTVTGPLAAVAVSLADGHTHVWIDDVGALDASAPILNQRPQIEQELSAFYAAGGRMMVDCQPGGCGRNGNMLSAISESTGVAIVASTGFHRRRYYPPHRAPVYEMRTEQAREYFVSELISGLEEAPHVRAGLIKIACEATLDESPSELIRAAVQASLETGAAIEVHTERGSDAEAIMRYMLDLGQHPEKLILCHMDKRADAALHQAIAAQGVRLEYDTFLRPKYQPEENAWPLLKTMLDAGYEGSLVLATDLADAQMWHFLGGGAGAAALIQHIKARLDGWGLPAATVARLLGGNVVASLLF